MWNCSLAILLQVTENVEFGSAVVKAWRWFGLKFLCCSYVKFKGVSSTVKPQISTSTWCSSPQSRCAALFTRIQGSGQKWTGFCGAACKPVECHCCVCKGCYILLTLYNFSQEMGPWLSAEPATGWNTVSEILLKQHTCYFSAFTCFLGETTKTQKYNHRT